MPNKSCNARVTWTGGVTDGDTGEFCFRDATGCRHGIVFSTGSVVDLFGEVPIYAAELKCRPCQSGTNFIVDDSQGILLIKTTIGGYYLGFNRTTGRLVLTDTPNEDGDDDGIDVELFNSGTGTYFTVRSLCGCKLTSNTVIIE
jgi:hypothetical protein